MNNTAEGPGGAPQLFEPDRKAADAFKVAADQTEARRHAVLVLTATV